MRRYFFSFIGIVSIGVVGFLTFKKISDSSYGSPNLANGKIAYVENCITCHGEKGLGDGVASQSMQIKPDSIYEELTNPFGLKAELINSVLSGDNGQDGTMPAFNGVLTEEDVNDIFGYIVNINDPAN